ncbi:uncharacterized protein [Musca autumnalis]|uniref:uncharacterized protein n=1 Tax=Musca autumnalis TaxID=221902 RepID=UPI003CE87D06
MAFKIAKRIWFLIGLTCSASAYVLDFYDISASSATPDIMDVYFKQVRISRGIYGFSGFMEVKQEFDTDVTKYKLDVFYSSNGLSYSLTPFRISPTPVTSVMNKEYLIYLKDMFDKCCTNAFPYPFFSPMTIRNMTCENCQFASNNFPTVLRVGFYKAVVSIYDKPNVTIIATGQIELS